MRRFGEFLSNGCRNAWLQEKKKKTCNKRCLKKVAFKEKDLKLRFNRKETRWLPSLHHKNSLRTWNWLALISQYFLELKIIQLFMPVDPRRKWNASKKHWTPAQDTSESGKQKLKMNHKAVPAPVSKTKQFVTSLQIMLLTIWQLLKQQSYRWRWKWAHAVFEQFTGLLYYISYNFWV